MSAGQLTGKQLIGRHARFGDGLILLARATADADCAHYLPALLQRNAAGENHHAPMVRGMNAEKLSAGLRVFRQILRGNIEGPRGEGFIDESLILKQTRLAPNLSSVR